MEGLSFDQDKEADRRYRDMKINQVAELAGMTSKNIRFYEDQGLIKPRRDPQNGYREYTLEDAKQLERIKLLRQLGISRGSRKRPRNRPEAMRGMDRRRRQ